MKEAISRRNLLAFAGAAGTIGAFGLVVPSAAQAASDTYSPQVEDSYFNDVSDGGAAARVGKTFDEWVADSVGKYINVDGAYGAQCWDLWESYCISVIGTSGISTRVGAHPHYAIALWDGFASNGAAAQFSQVSASAVPQKGDVAIWKWGSALAPWSHVAVVLGDAGSNVYCLSQNSSPSVAGNPYPQQSTGPTIKQNLPKAGLAGYLRPKYSSSSPTIRSAGDLLAVDPYGVLWVYPSFGNGRLGTRVKIGPGWDNMTTGWTVDWNGNGVYDIVTLWNDGGLRLYQGQSGGGFSSSQSIGIGWQGRQIAPSRFDKSDALPGLLAKDSSGNLWNYTNASGGALTTNGKTQIGQGWGDLSILPFDFNGDGNQDVLGIDSANLLRLYKGNGAGAFIGGGTQVGIGWSFVSVASSTGFAGPGTRGLFAQASDGQLYYYPVNSTGTFGTRSLIGTGWNNYTILNSQRLS